MLSKLCLFFALVVPTCHADPVHIVNPQAHLNITTPKVAHITDEIDMPAEFVFEKEIAETLAIPGPRVIIIDSPGGRVDVGDKMINLMLAEKKTGVRMICVVNEAAHSMAFNFLTMCDVRLATADTQCVVHKIALGGMDPSVRLTAKLLKQLSQELEEGDEIYRQNNAKAMHLSLEDYDRYADEQHIWSAAVLYLNGYLDGIATIDNDPAMASPSK